MHITRCPQREIKGQRVGGHFLPKVKVGGGSISSLIWKVREGLI